MSRKFGLPRIEPELALELVEEIGLRDDDALLVEAARRGHRGAGKRIYERHVEAVQAFLWRLLGPQPDFDDLVQDVFYFAFRSIHKLREPSSLRSWLFGITLGRVKARARSRHRKSWLSYAPSDELPEPWIEYDDASAELVREVRELLERLPKEERLALVLHRVVGLPIDTSAKASGMSLSTFKRRLSRGESRLQATAGFRPAIAEWRTLR
jgi:RNA polymerase sigma-70 factor (ECF subfamily)